MASEHTSEASQLGDSEDEDLKPVSKSPPIPSINERLGMYVLWHISVSVYHSYQATITKPRKSDRDTVCDQDRQDRQTACDPDRQTACDPDRQTACDPDFTPLIILELDMLHLTQTVSHLQQSVMLHLTRTVSHLHQSDMLHLTRTLSCLQQSAIYS